MKRVTANRKMSTAGMATRWPRQTLENKAFSRGMAAFQKSGQKTPFLRELRGVAAIPGDGGSLQFLHVHVAEFDLDVVTLEADVPGFALEAGVLLELLLVV